MNFSLKIYLFRRISLNANQTFVSIVANAENFLNNLIFCLKLVKAAKEQNSSTISVSNENNDDVWMEDSFISFLRLYDLIKWIIL